MGAPVSLRSFWINVGSVEKDRLSISCDEEGLEVPGKIVVVVRMLLQQEDNKEEEEEGTSERFFLALPMRQECRAKVLVMVCHATFV